jgi:polyferredoxin
MPPKVKETGDKTVELSHLPTRQRIRRKLIFFLMLAFPLTFNYYSPVLPIMGTLAGVVSFSLLFWTLWFITSLVLGRGGCGWFCPLGGLQELYDQIVSKPLKSVAYLGWLRFILCLLWLAGIVLAVAKADFWKRIDLLYMTENLVSWDRLEGSYIYVGMFGLVLLFAGCAGRRGFCHYFCWYAPLNMAGNRLASWCKLPRLHLNRTEVPCRGCGHCTSVCPMSLPVADMVRANNLQHPECILCGSCCDTCRTSCIAFSWHNAGIRPH